MNILGCNIVLGWKYLHFKYTKKIHFLKIIKIFHLAVEINRLPSESKHTYGNPYKKPVLKRYYYKFYMNV